MFQIRIAKIGVCLGHFSLGLNMFSMNQANLMNQLNTSHFVDLSITRGTPSRIYLHFSLHRF